jgi:hypothetical protein
MLGKMENMEHQETMDKQDNLGYQDDRETQDLMVCQELRYLTLDLVNILEIPARELYCPVTIFGLNQSIVNRRQR